MAKLMTYETPNLVIYYDGFDEWREMNMAKVELKIDGITYADMGEEQIRDLIFHYEDRLACWGEKVDTARLYLPGLIEELQRKTRGTIDEHNRQFGEDQTNR